MIFGFDARVGQVADLDGQVNLFGGGLNDTGDIHDGKTFGELIVNAAFVARGGILAGNFDAAHGVANIEEAAALAALAVYGKRMPDDGFNAEAIEDGAENFVVIKTVDERFVERDFVGDGAVHHALIQIGGAQAPDFAGEHDVVAIVHFGEVVERAGLFGKGKNVLAAVVLDGDVAFFDVNVRSAVLAHGAEFDEVAIGLQFAQSKKQIQRADYVVDLGVHGVATVNHGVGGRALFGEMNDGLGFEIFDYVAEEFVVADIAHVGFDGSAGQAVPGGEAIGERADGSEGLRAQLVVPLAADEVVHDGHFVALLRQIEGRGPSAISVST